MHPFSGKVSVSHLVSKVSVSPFVSCQLMICYKDTVTGLPQNDIIHLYRVSCLGIRKKKKKHKKEVQKAI